MVADLSLGGLGFHLPGRAGISGLSAHLFNTFRPGLKRRAALRSVALVDVLAVAKREVLIRVLLQLVR
jgi:hypothetical protein